MNWDRHIEECFAQAERTAEEIFEEVLLDAHVRVSPAIDLPFPPAYPFAHRTDHEEDASKAWKWPPAVG